MIGTAAPKGAGKPQQAKWPVMPALFSTKRPFNQNPVGNAIGAAEQRLCLCRRLAGEDDVEMRRQMINPRLVPDHIANADKRLDHKKAAAAGAGI